MAEIADADLPVFPFKVNWKNGISERLEWKTDILTDLVGNEQRRGLRLHPRRDFEVTLTLWDQERQFLDLWLHRMVGTEFLFPLWHDSVRSTQDAAQAQKTIRVDTQGLEFQIGSYALLRGLTAMSFERVLIAEVHADRIVAVDNLARAWPKGTRVEPLVRGQMSDQTRVTLVTSKASTIQAEFQTTRAQLYDPGEETMELYMGLPVITQQPNRSDQLDVRHVWNFYESDSGSGRRYRKSEEDRARVSQKHSWFLRGRVNKAAFRSMLYRLDGARVPFWLPTFNEDITLAQDAAPGAVSIYVKEFGFAYTGGPSSGREHIVIQTTTGRIYRRVIGTAAAPAGQERLVLNAALPAGLTRAGVRIISWIDTARLENDRIEFNHVNAADGVSTVTSICKTFRNERVPPAVLSAPIPVTMKNATPCGENTELCYEIPYLAEFEGWLWEWVWVTQRQDGPHPGAGTIFSVLNTPDPYSLVSNDGQITPFGPKFSMEYIIDGSFLYQRMKMVEMPLNGEYEVIIDPNNLYPPTRYSFAGRPWTAEGLSEYWTADGGGFFGGGFARSGTFDFTDGV